MAKTIFPGKKKSEQEDQQKTRKKDAKKEAKLVYQVDQAKKDVHKAEQKAAKAQTNLQDLQAHLQKLEEELAQLRNPGHSATTTVQAEAKSDTAQSSDDLQTSSPAEGRSDIDASAATSEAATNTTEVQPASPPPAGGRSDTAQEDAIEALAGTTSTPIENIPTRQSDETASAQVHSDISMNPVEEDLTINSGDGSIPVVTSDENAWPPPHIRDEIAESIVEDAAQESSTATRNAHSEPVAQVQPTVENAQAEENLAITSGDGSIPVVTSDENAWPPPHIRDEIAESIVEEVDQEHGSNGYDQANKSDVEEGTENHDAEHEASQPRRSTRRKTRSSAQPHINKTDQE